MKNYNYKLFYVFLVLIGFAVTYPAFSSGSEIVRVNGVQVTMENEIGCKLDFYYENGKYVNHSVSFY